jgi:hypothetical protein
VEKVPVKWSRPVGCPAVLIVQSTSVSRGTLSVEPSMVLSFVRVVIAVVWPTCRKCPGRSIDGVAYRTSRQ